MVEKKAYSGLRMPNTERTEEKILFVLNGYLAKLWFLESGGYALLRMPQNSQGVVVSHPCTVLSICSKQPEHLRGQIRVPFRAK
jgi:hypothetical protein